MQHTQQTHSARPTRQEAPCPGGLPVPVARGPLRLESGNPKHVREVGACSSPEARRAPEAPGYWAGSGERLAAGLAENSGVLGTPRWFLVL